MKRKNLKFLRIKNDLTQEQMAEKLEVCKATYNFVETGKRQGNTEFWQNLQKAFDVPDEEMFKLMKCEN